MSEESYDGDWTPAKGKGRSGEPASDEQYGLSLERAVLGLLLLEPTLAARAERELTVEDFSDRRNAAIFETTCALVRGARDAGPGGVGLELARIMPWGPDDERYLATLLSEPGASDPRAFPERAKALADEARRRRAAALLTEAAKSSRKRGTELPDTLGALRKELAIIEAASGLDELPPIGKSVDELLAILETGIDAGVPTGLPNLDEAIQGGIRPTQLIVIAGNTGSGKTSLATQIALLAAQWASIRPSERGQVLYFSLEMSALELVTRMVSQVTSISDGYRAPSGFSRRDMPKAIEALRRIRLLPIRLEVPRASTVAAIRAASERFIGEHGIPSLIVVDHIGLLRDPKVRGGRTEEVGAITRGLKEMAMQLQVGVLALAQLNREVGKRDDHRPQLTDLRESGCVTGDTGVFLPDEGVYRPIRELVGQTGFRVLALNTDTWKNEPAGVTAAFSTGVKPVFRLRTKRGREVRATANHKFRTLGGWHRLDELEVGRRIALPRSLPSPKTVTLTDEQLGLLGHLIGDGCTLPRHVMQYTTRERDLAEIVSGLATAVFGSAIAPRINAERTWYQVYLSKPGVQNVWVSNPLTTWLKELGAFGLRSYEKRVPEQVFAQPRTGIACFLRHLWATDGCLRAAGAYPSIYYATSSEGLAHDISSLLLRLGIAVRIRPVDQGTKGRTQYHVTVSGREEIQSFLAEVGAVGERRQTEALAITARLSEMRANTNRDIVPIETWDEIVEPVMAAVGMTSRTLATHLGLVPSGLGVYRIKRNGMSRGRADQISIATGSVDLARLANSDVYWDEIVSIEPDGDEETFDLTVAGLHNFAANDIIIHNSIEQDSNIVALVHRPSYYQKDLEERRRLEEQGAEAFVYIAKNRSGPTAEVRFDWVGPRYLFRIPADWFERTGMLDDYGLIESPVTVPPGGSADASAPLDLGPIADLASTGPEDPGPDDDLEVELFA